MFFSCKKKKIKSTARLVHDFESRTRALLFLFPEVKRFLRDMRRIQQKAGSKMLKP